MTSCAVANEAVPAVFPAVDMPPENCVRAAVAGAETRNDPLLNPTDIAPAPSIENALKGIVLEDDCPVVLPTPMSVRVLPPPPGIEAVIVEPLRPKLTPFRLEKTTDPRFLLVVPAEKLRFEKLPVRVDPLSPKLRPLEFENTIWERLLLVVPAEIFGCAPTAETVTSPLLKPKLMPLVFENALMISLPDRLAVATCPAFQ